jgi:hypothetical protein
MFRKRALKVVLVVVGLLFVALAYPMLVLSQEEALQMMLSVYVTLGVFLLLAARNPSAYRSVIAFAGWSSLAHTVVMGAQAYYDAAQRMHFLIGDIALLVIGLALLALAPAKPTPADA